MLYEVITEIRVEKIGTPYAESSTLFYAGWYAALMSGVIQVPRCLRRGAAHSATTREKDVL